jgi:DNA-binding CsgD family transcriptional regulator/tetratricopeptide (TPR) repeat protein
MELLERDAQLMALEERLAEVCGGSGQAVFVAGEAGVGKTALVTAFLERVRVRQASGACDPLLTPSALAPLRDIAADLGGRLAELARADAARDTLFRALLDALGDEPAVVVLEDAHWADEATLDLLRFIGRRLVRTQGLLVVTYRDDEVGPTHPLRVVVGDLSTAPAVTTLQLAPLSRSAVATLAQPHAIDAVELHRLTGGNPFYVTEAIAAGGSGVPRTVRDAVLARAARVDPSVRRALEAVATVPARIEGWLLESLTGGDASAVDAAVEAGMLRPDAADAVAFRHELARLAIEESMPPGRHRQLHAAVAQALVDRYGDAVDAARVAHHASAAGNAELTVRYAVAAAERASRLGAHREAADQYERAVDHAADAPPPQRAALLERYAEAAADIGRRAEAVTAASGAIALRRLGGDRVATGNALRLSAGMLWTIGEPDAAEAAAQEAVELLELEEPGPELAEAYALMCYLRMLQRETAECLEWGERAIALAERLGVYAALARALNSVGCARILAGLPGGRELLERSADVAARIGHDWLVSIALSNLGSASGEVRDYATAESSLRDAIAYGAARDLDGQCIYSESWLSRTRFEQGDWTSAEQVATPIAESDASLISRIVTVTVLGRLAARRGEVSADGQLAEAWQMSMQSDDLQRLWPAAAARGELAWLSGRPGEIPGLVESTYQRARHLNHRWGIGELALLLHRAGALDGVPPDAAPPYALHLMGDVRAAAAAWRDLGCPYEAADALLDGDAADLRDALSAFTALGARPAAALARRRLNALGVHAVPRGPRPATRANAALLTPRQLEIVTLLADGLTDAKIGERLFLSRKTVGHHVSAILDKLGVESRREVADAAQRLGVPLGR